jgi:aconitate hydratase
MSELNDPFHIRKELHSRTESYSVYSLPELAKQSGADFDRMPYSIRILIEALVRQIDDKLVTKDHLDTLLDWSSNEARKKEIPFMPARVIMQDFTGVPAVVDLAVMRDAIADLGGEPDRINPQIPVDLIIDHSVQVDLYGTPEALRVNAEMEFKRNRERYEFLRWGAQYFENLRVVPPATGIVHQVNLEYLASVVRTDIVDGRRVAYPDTLVGTDSHTTMINGVGVLGWGVGGIEAEAVMLGRPYYMLTPEVIGFKLGGALKEGVTATDLVLTVTEKLRKFGVVGKIVEFFGGGLADLSVEDRATISNMSPEYGATAGYFPVDAQTVSFLKRTGRSDEQIDLVERYAKEQRLFRAEDSPEPSYTDVIEFDIGTVVPSIAGPKRPQDRIALSDAKRTYHAMIGESKKEKAAEVVDFNLEGKEVRIQNGAVVIAAITSCTNTSNPSVMMAAGLLAVQAHEKGLTVGPCVKTSLAPGSRVVARYLENAGVVPALDALGFNIVGYGCTTCIGNSGPLKPEIQKAIEENDLTVAGVLSGNRNFEGRIHPSVKANYLASPPLVVAYALAGTVDIDLTTDPLGFDKEGTPVFLKELWPSTAEIESALRNSLTAGLFKSEYADIFTGNETWNKVKISGEKRYAWDEKSTYIRKPTFFDGLSANVPERNAIIGAKVLAMLGDSVTTDHISPAGAIPKDSPASRLLTEQGVAIADFNSFGSRRGNHEVMVRGTFGNIRIRNKLVPEKEGGYTLYQPTGETMFIYDAAVAYGKDGTPLIILAGKEYGSGSSRDWAAKGPALQGVKAVIAESYERIHRSNLIGMGVLPLQFRRGENASTLDLSGLETFDIQKVITPGQSVEVDAVDENGKQKSFVVLARIDTPVEYEYFVNGGILHTVLLNIAHKQ